MKMQINQYIQLTCALSILTPSTSSSLAVDSLLELMTLTELACGGIHWCTVQSPVTMATHVKACCPRCSCDHNCTTSGLCCPDITLSDYLDGQVFPNILEHAAVLNQTMTSDLEARMYESMNTSVDDKTEEMQCIKSRLFPKSATIPNSPMYVMVSKCTNLSVSPEAKTKCESPAIVDPDKTDIKELLPLQSTSTGLVYRNKYCKKCTLHDPGPFLDWDVWIATDLTQLEIQSYHFSTMHDVFKVIFQQDQIHGAYDIFFKPSRDFEDLYPPDMCHTFNVQACKHDTMVSQATKAACDSYILPVFGFAEQSSSFLRNIACLSCNDHHFPYTCSSSYRWGAPITFLGRVRQMDIPMSEGSTQADLLTTFGPECDPGHIYDTKRNVCRKIYCPCMMMVFDSRCVSIFEEVIYKKFFSVYIDLVIRSRVKDQRNDSEDQAAIFKYVQQVFENSDDFQTDHIALGVTKGDNPNPKRYFVFIAFTGKNEHIFFPDVIAFISRHFRGIKRMAKNNDLRIKMDITDSMDIFMHGITNINTGHSYEFAMTTFDMFSKDNLIDRSKLQVSECHFCHMIELLEDEMDKIGFAVYVKPSQTLERRFSTFVSNNSRILVCAAKVISNVDARLKTIEHERDDHLRPTTDADAGPAADAGSLEPAISVIELTAFGSTLGFLVVTVCILATVQWCLKHRRLAQLNSQDSNAGQVETQ